MPGSGSSKFTPPVKAKTSARWATRWRRFAHQLKIGPRAALTRWGVPEVPEPGKTRARCG
jgi:hypothetical protein